MDSIKAQLMEQAINAFKGKCSELGVPIQIVDILVSVVNND